MDAPAPHAPVRIAMWSGPRNISTAMMRSWEARGDAAVSDEPLYSHYLRATGRDHPGAAEVIATHPHDWRAVTAALVGPAPESKPAWYQKHMAHHLLPNIERGWIARLSNAFLIRDPREMLASLEKVLPNPTLEETGLPQQVELFDEQVQRMGIAPPVVDARDILENPAGMLRALCRRLGVTYTDRMLSWRPGPRATDGVWAKHWYAAVERSTGFEPPAQKADEHPARLLPLLKTCEPLYATLWKHRLTVEA